MDGLPDCILFIVIFFTRSSAHTLKLAPANFVYISSPEVYGSIESAAGVLNKFKSMKSFYASLTCLNAYDCTDCMYRGVAEFVLM